MNNIISLIKILKFIPDHWNDVLQNAKDLEVYLDKSKSYLETNDEKVKDLINNFFDYLKNNKDQLKTSFKEIQFYQKLQDVVINYPEFITVPSDFDPDNRSQFITLVQKKVQLLEPLLLALLIDNTKVDEVISLVKEIVNDLIDGSENLDFDNNGAVTQWKNEKIEQLKPKVFDLIKLILPSVDLKNSPVDNAINNVNDVLDILVTDNDAKPIDNVQSIANSISKNLKDANFTDVDKIEDYLPVIVECVQKAIILAEFFADTNIDLSLNKTVDESTTTTSTEAADNTTSGVSAVSTPSENSLTNSQDNLLPEFIDTVIKQLSTSKVFAQSIRDGNLLQGIMDDFSKPAQYQDILDFLTDKQKAFLNLITKNPSPVIGVILDFVAASLFELAELVRDLCLRLSNEIFQQLLSFANLLNEVKLPESLCPAWLYKFITGSENINMLCLFFSLPISTIQGLLPILKFDT